MSTMAAKPKSSVPSLYTSWSLGSATLRANNKQPGTDLLAKINGGTTPNSNDSSSKNTDSLNSSPASSPIGTGSTQKYGTVVGLSGVGAAARERGKLSSGLFDDPSGDEDDVGGGSGVERAGTALGHVSTGVKGNGSGKGAGGHDGDGEWSISVAERKVGGKVKSRSKKAQPTVFTLYVTTPTSNLTLARTVTQIAELDVKLRSALPARLPSQKPALIANPPGQTPPRKRNVLQTLSRTLSPNRRSHGNVMSILNPPASPVKGSSKEVDDLIIDPTIETAGTPPTPSTISQIGSYLTQLAKEAPVRKQESWKAFFKVGSEDLESVRVERRVKRVRSDLASHLSPKKESKALPEADSKKEAGRKAEAAARERAEQMEREAQDVETDAEQDADSSSLRAHLKGQGIVTIFPDDYDAPTPTTAEASRTDFRPTDTKDFEDGQPVPGSPSKSMGDLRSSAGRGSGGNAEDIEAENSDEAVIRMPTRPHSADPEKAMSNSPRKSKVIALPGSDKPRIRRKPTNKEEKHAAVEDFELMRVLGKGCAGKVLLVRYRPTRQLYAMKAIHKHHVLAHRELQHTLTEQSVLKTIAKEQSNPFVVKLWWSFHDRERLFLVMDFHPGGDLATQLARWGRLGRDRARFYAAEIVEGLEGLHNAGVIYRDLKPENILIAADGHCILTDFGLSKQFSRNSDGMSASLEGNSEGGPPGPRPFWLKQNGGKNHSAPPGFWDDEQETTTTFCGTAEYLAPEVLLGEPYSYGVDFWSFGTMLYEMLTGMTPFWNEDHSIMYRRVLHEELSFNDDARVLDQDTKSLLRGLLQKLPALRMTHNRIKKHPYFSMIDWSHVYHKRYIPPYIPTLNPEDDSDTQNFDDIFLNMKPALAEPDEAEGEGNPPEKPPSGEPQEAVDEHGRDVFEGYSFKGPDTPSVNGDGGSMLDQDMEGEEDEGDMDGDMGGEGDEEFDENGHTSSSAHSNSTRPTSLGGAESHGRQRSGGLDSLVEDPTTSPSPKPKSEKYLDADLVLEEDWDMVEAVDESMAERNGGNRVPTLFARGVVDRYRMRIARTRKRRDEGTSRPSSRLGPRPESRLSSRSSITPSDSLNETSDAQRSKPLTTRLASAERLRIRPKRSRKSVNGTGGPNPNNNGSSSTPTQVPDSTPPNPSKKGEASLQSSDEGDLSRKGSRIKRFNLGSNIFRQQAS